MDEVSLKEEIFSLTGGRGAEVVIVGPNSVEAIKTGMQCLAPGGTLVLFTPTEPGETLSFEPNEIYFRDIRIVTSYSCGPDNTMEALSLIKTGLVRAEELVTHRFPLGETFQAYKIVAQARDSLKVVIVF